MPSSFEREIYNATLCTILYWAVHTDDLDDTNDLADFIEEALLAYALNRQKEVEKDPAIIEDAFEHEIYTAALCTILYWAVFTDDLDDTDDLANFLEEVLRAYALKYNRQSAKQIANDEGILPGLVYGNKALFTTQDWGISPKGRGPLTKLTKQNLRRLQTNINQESPFTTTKEHV
ncbi:hypothetical protein E4U17_003967 [Claviceps sp. LM77 group G4]|nr:hypothetical protein E4U17_003967 [Claviceps sp. LM77 group G4]KAG6070929.1 hypothetical protein E4U33_003950 [Claviceps sp. LM78 group G4]KAG6080153.1 hypothetical protein E4U16_000561 [Claviceps sp. LM84 group G4]